MYREVQECKIATQRQTLGTQLYTSKSDIQCIWCYIHCTSADSESISYSESWMSFKNSSYRNIYMYLFGLFCHKKNNFFNLQKLSGRVPAINWRSPDAASWIFQICSPILSSQFSEIPEIVIPWRSNNENVQERCMCKRTFILVCRISG